MSQSIRISFGPCDPLNPEFGYEFTAESRKGVEMRTANNLDTGEPLTIHDCIALAQTFFGPDPGDVVDTYDDYKAGRDAGAEAAAQRCEKSGYVNGDLHAELIRKGVK